MLSKKTAEMASTMLIGICRIAKFLNIKTEKDIGDELKPGSKELKRMSNDAIAIIMSSINKCDNCIYLFTGDGEMYFVLYIGRIIIMIDSLGVSARIGTSIITDRTDFLSAVILVNNFVGEIREIQFNSEE